MNSVRILPLLLGSVAFAPAAFGIAAAQDMQPSQTSQDDSASDRDMQQSKDSKSYDKSMKSADKGDKNSKRASGKTIVDVASGNDNFTTLVKAVEAAELGDTLTGEGPYTVFAPTNAAFDQLPQGALDLLLADENKEALKTVLTYHVVSGKVRAADLVKMIRDNDGEATVDTVEGTQLTARIRNGDVVLTDEAGNDIRVVNTNLNASNGVVHVVDGVLLPASGDGA